MFRMPVVTLFLLAAPVGALAQTPAYVGKWDDDKSCKLDQSDQGATLIM